MDGIERLSIAEAFARARAERPPRGADALLDGWLPDLRASREIGLAYARAGADLVELGVPFSDPLADGPLIHGAGTAALAAGATLPAVLEVGAAIAELVPVIVMCYANPIFARGLERFLDALVQAGASGVIVPDLPLEEAEQARAACDARGLALVPLVAPTTPDARLAKIGALARGFLYTVSVTGTTGERSGVDGGLEALIARVRARSTGPGRRRVRDRDARAGRRGRRLRGRRGDRRQPPRPRRRRGAGAGAGGPRTGRELRGGAVGESKIPRRWA